MGVISRGAGLPVVIILFLVSLFAASVQDSYAEDYAAAQVYVHAFNNNVTVYTGVFALNKDFTLNTSGYAKYTVDFINPDFFDFGEGHGGDDDALSRSSARVAAVSGASAAGGSDSDTRNDLTFGVTHNFDNLIGVELYYDFSYESDYVSHTPTITLKKDLFSKNTTITLGYSRNIDTVSGKYMAGEASRNTDNYYVGLTQVLSPVMLAQVGYSQNVSKGFESEGIRLVPVDGATADTCTALSATCVAEVFPDSRTRRAYLLGLNRYFIEGLGGLLNRSSVKLSFRYYDDDWDINSYMGEVEFHKYLDEATILRLNYRYYDQTRAFFIKDAYLSSDAFKSASPQLEEFNTNLVGVKVTRFLSEPSGSLNSVEGKYEYYKVSSGVAAHILMFALRFVF